MSIPRNEYPRPQLMRENWINLNGKWSFETDNSLSGKYREYYKRESFENEITVPFCPESKLSGIGNTDFMYCVWYRKNISIPSEWKGKRIILHFGAVDYKASVYVNGEFAGTHSGGYTSFSFDITDYLNYESDYITVCAEDDLRLRTQPGGKQSPRYESYGCYYTRTTGIWQTVWMECVEENYVESLKIDTDIDTPSVTVRLNTHHAGSGYSVRVKAFYGGNQVGCGSASLLAPSPYITIVLSERHLWEVGEGRLYDLEIELYKGGSLIDKVKSYFGLRSVCMEGNAFVLNGKKVYGRWVLDQGFYPDGIYTAPDDEALKADVVNSMKLGFNGARLHEKIFEPRFLYWADKLGYMVWGEHANWGFDHTDSGKIYSFLPEWIESVERDYNHPSIIGWCPFNETWDVEGKRQSNELLGLVFDITKKLDPTRPVIDSSGSFHVRTDMFDIHDYAQSAEGIAKVFDKKDDGILNSWLYLNQSGKGRHTYKNGDPIFVSEYGGIAWNMEADDEFWGYGNAPKTKEEFIARYKEITHYLLDNKDICAFCYTQLYDVEQERNGLMTYDRKFKFEPEIFYEINTKKAAIEE